MPVEFTGTHSNATLTNYPLVLTLKHPELDVWRRIVFPLPEQTPAATAQGPALKKMVEDLVAAGWTEHRDYNEPGASMRVGAVEIIRL